MAGVGASTLLARSPSCTWAHGRLSQSPAAEQQQQRRRSAPEWGGWFPQRLRAQPSAVRRVEGRGRCWRGGGHQPKPSIGIREIRRDKYVAEQCRRVEQTRRDASVQRLNLSVLQQVRGVLMHALAQLPDGTHTRRNHGTD
jgi:hypothetical protein